jgi:ferritin
MSSYFESISLAGFASWMRAQAQEEMAHVMKFFTYMIERGGRVVLDAIKKPDTEWASPLAAFEDAFKHECYISGCINELVSLSLDEKDHATHNMLQWFVAEQVEEEASADEVVQRLKLVGDDGAGLFMIDQELGKRMAAPLTLPEQE